VPPESILWYAFPHKWLSSYGERWAGTVISVYMPPSAALWRKWTRSLRHSWTNKRKKLK
jgi:hypothetical protein